MPCFLIDVTPYIAEIHFKSEILGDRILQAIFNLYELSNKCGDAAPFYLLLPKNLTGSENSNSTEMISNRPIHIKQIKVSFPSKGRSG